MGRMESQLGFGFDEHQEFLDYLGANKTDDGFEPTRIPKPTEASPGTWSKVEVLAARLAAGEELWHPDDKPIDLTKKLEDSSLEDIAYSIFSSTEPSDD